MHDEHDVWNTAVYHRAIQKRVGEALSARHGLPRHLPSIGYAYSYVSSTNRRLRPQQRHPRKKSLSDPHQRQPINSRSHPVGSCDMVKGRVDETVS
jgi:hypothetical protein